MPSIQKQSIATNSKWTVLEYADTETNNEVFQDAMTEATFTDEFIKHT
jgi:hypothetical protein